MADKADFIQQMYQAGLAAGLTDAAARVMAAQAGIESGYGDRAPGNNYFAITKGNDWSGPTIARVDKDSKGNPITQQFRSYTSAAAGLADRVAYMDVHFPGFNDAPTVPAALAVLQKGTFGKYYEAPQAKYEASVNGIIKKYVPPTPAPKITPIPPLDIPIAGNLKIVDVTKGGEVRGGAVPANPFADRLRTGKIEGVVIHHTGGEGLLGAMLAGQAEGPQHGTSAQYYVDRDGTIYRYAPDSSAAIDIREPGGKFRTDKGQPSYILGNQNSIGIETVGFSKDFTPAQKASIAALTASLQQTYKFDPSMIVGHGDIQGGPGGNKVPYEGVEAAAYARSAILGGNDALAAIDAISPHDQAVAALGYTVGKPAATRLAAMTSGVTARQKLYASAAAGVRLDPGAGRVTIPEMTPGQKYDGGAMRSAAPTSDAEFFRLLTPAPDNYDAVGDGPASWFTNAPDVAPGGVGSNGFTTSGAALHVTGDKEIHPGLNGQADFAAPKPGTPATGFNTVLDPRQEAKFQEWKSTVAPQDSGQDYDFRGAFAAGINPDPKTGHWPDTFKKPNEPTFSVESQYAKYAPALAGHWDGDTYVPAALSLEDRDAAFAARVRGIPVPMPGRPTFPATAPVPMPGRPASLAGHTVSSDRPLTAQEVRTAAARQIIHVGKHDYEVGQTFDQGGFHYIVTADGIEKRRLQTGEKTIVSGVVGGIIEEGATKAVTAAGQTLPGAGKAIEAGADVLHEKLNAGTANVTRSLAGGVVSIGNFFSSFAPAPTATPSWQVAVQRALVPQPTVKPPAGPAPAVTVPKSVEQTPAGPDDRPSKQAVPITTSGSSVDPRGGNIPESKAHAPQAAPTYTAPIKAVPSTKPTTRIETRDVPNPEYTAWVKNQPGNAAVTGKLQDIHDRNDAATLAAQTSAPAQTIRVSRAVPVGGDSLGLGGEANTAAVDGIAGVPAGVAHGISLGQLVRGGEIAVQPRATITPAPSARSSSAQVAAQQAVKIASGKTVNAGTMGTSQGGRYVFQVQNDGSIKELNSGRTTAPAPSSAPAPTRTEQAQSDLRESGMLDSFGMIH